MGNLAFSNWRRFKAIILIKLCFCNENEHVYLIDNLKDVSGAGVWIKLQVGFLVVPDVFFGSVGELID